MFLLLLCSLFSLKSKAQFTQQDSVIVTDNQVTSKSNTIWSMFSGNPGRAALYSAILPGAGQYYNKTYWKIPVVLAVEGITLGIFIDNQRTFKRFDQLLTDIANGEVSETQAGISLRELELRTDMAEQYRDLSLIALIVVHFIQISDAFISRHLIEFDVSDDLSMKVNPSQNVLGLNIAFHF